MSKFWHERTNETEHCWMHSFASRASAHLNGRVFGQ